MIKLILNDRFIKGEVVFESFGDTARMSYRGKPTLPVNTQYNLDGKEWRTVKVSQSDFNDLVVNVDMVLINGG